MVAVALPKVLTPIIIAKLQFKSVKNDQKLNFKNIFKITYLLISSPTRAWEEISVSKPSSQRVLNTFVYPMIGLVGLAVFAGVIIDHFLRNEVAISNPLFHEALMAACSIFISDFVGYFLAVWILDWLSRHLYQHCSNKNAIGILVGYSMSVLFVLQFITGLLSVFILLQSILQFYIIYVVWEGIKKLHLAGKKRLMSFTIMSSITILVSQEIVSKVYQWLTIFLN